MNEVSSLVRFANQQGENGQPLHWHRAGEDGAPFRGQPQMMREEEYEQRAVRVGDPKVKIFTISPDHAEEVAEYQDVLTKVVNGGWGQILHVDRQYNAEKGHWMVYLEWVQWYMQDGHPSAAQEQNTQAGSTNGQQQPSLIPLPAGPFPGQDGAGF